MKLPRIFNRGDKQPPVEETVSTPVEETASSTLANPSPELLSALLVGPTAAGPSVTPNSAMRSVAVYAAIRIIAESIATLPLILYERTDDGGKERAVDHPLHNVLRWQPNSVQTAFNYWEQVVTNIASFGNSYSFIQRNNRADVVALWPLCPDRVRIHVGKNNVLTYFVQSSQGGEVLYKEEDILHFKLYSKDGIIGVSPIRMAREAIGAGLAMEEYASRFFSNDATPSIILETGGILTDERRKSLKEQWESLHQGTKNAHKTAVLEDGLKATALSISPQDSQFIESRKFQLQEIARIFRVPPHMLADLSKSSFNNIQEQGIDFVTHTIRPWTTRIEQEIRKSLLLPSDQDKHFAEFMLQDLMRGNQKARYESYRIARQDGWMSANEIRSFENLNPIENGDEYLLPLNMAPAEQVVNSSNQLVPEVASTIPPEATKRIPSIEIAAQSQPARWKLANDSKQKFEAAASEILEQELPALRSLLREHENNPVELKRSLESFYQEHRASVEEVLEPLYRSYAEDVQRLAVEEVDETAIPDIEKFLLQVVGAATARWVGSSENQLRKLIDESPDFEAVETRLDEWEEKRSDKFANTEPVRVGGAIAKTTFLAVGITRFMWRTVGKNCPYCNSLSGKIIGTQETFLSDGQGIEPDGLPPLVAKRNINHPPVHRACDCIVEAVRE